MKVEMKIPSMGESVVEATIGTILKSSGAVVRSDEEILEIETDKVNQVLFAPAAGQIQLHVKQGDVVKIGQVIGTVETEGAPKEVPKLESQPQVKIEPKEAPKAPLPAPGVRKKIDETIAELTSPPKIEKQVAASSDSLVSKKETRKKMTKLRRIIAERLVQVKNQTAMLTTFNELDMSTIIAIREKEQEQFQKKHGVKLGFMSFFVKACISALQAFPAIHARIEGDEIVYARAFDIGVAVGTEKGLMVPVIRNADQLSYAEIEKALKNFAEKARSSTLSVDDMQGGSFTITNGGVYGSLLSTPILNPPQSGILGMHNIVKRPVVVDDQIVIRPMMYIALSYDHRIVDGKDSIGFLVHLKKSLEEPTRLLLDV